MPSSTTPWLRVEGLAVAVAATLAYAHFHFSWTWFLVFFLAPDLAMVGYLGGARAGAWCYNICHTYGIALPLAVFGFSQDHRLVLAGSIILCAHIGADRCLGYGLKSTEGFRFTHLGKVGHESKQA